MKVVGLNQVLFIFVHQGTERHNIEQTIRNEIHIVQAPQGIHQWVPNGDVGFNANLSKFIFVDQIVLDHLPVVADGLFDRGTIIIVNNVVLNFIAKLGDDARQ